jgi:hypothetical protein
VDSKQQHRAPSALVHQGAEVKRIGAFKGYSSRDRLAQFIGTLFSASEEAPNTPSSPVSGGSSSNSLETRLFHWRTISQRQLRRTGIWRTKSSDLRRNYCDERNWRTTGVAATPLQSRATSHRSGRLATPATNLRSRSIHASAQSSHHLHGS